MSLLRKLGALALAATLVAGPATAAPGLTPVERRMVAAASADTDRWIALLERLVNTNSGTLNLLGVEEVGRMMRAELEPLGFQVRWVPMTQVGRAGHLVATHKGSGRGKRMLLIGHLDTVFEPDSPFQRFVRRGDVAEGPGSNDMKGGLVVMTAALRAMQAAGVLKDADVTIVLTGDEERVGTPQSVSRADLLAAARGSDLALEFETLARQNGADMGSIARRSSSGWTLKVTGKQGHSSGIFSEGSGAGAVYELARILDSFRRELPEPYLTFNTGIAVGGTTAELDAATGGRATGKQNIIPAQAMAQGDIRTLSQEQTARVREKMKAIVAKHLPQTGAEISFTEGYPAMAPTAESRALLGKLNEVNRDLGLPLMAELDPLQRGAGDIAFVAGIVPGLVGVGAAGSGAHGPGETVDLRSLERQAHRAALLMHRLSREPRAR
jgi:glutamate carboxypeptidase